MLNTHRWNKIKKKTKHNVHTCIKRLNGPARLHGSTCAMDRYFFSEKKAATLHFTPNTQAHNLLSAVTN